MIQAASNIVADPRSILQEHAIYAGDPGMVYMSGDEPYIVPMLERQLLKAAVIPCKNPEAFNRAASAITPEQIQKLENTESFEYRDGQLTYDGSRTFPNMPYLVMARLLAVSDYLNTHKPGDENIYLRIFAHRPGKHSAGEFPELHTDFFVAHSTVYGAPLEYEDGFFNRGEIVALGHALRHKSSRHIPEQGQIAIVGIYDPR